MKGLFKNNFFAVCSNIKIFSALMFLLGIFVAAVISPALLIGYGLLSIVGFSVIAITSIKKEFVSKWGKYKLTLPINRANIVKSYYISQLIWLIAGIIFAGTSISLSWVLHGCPFDNNIDTLSVFTLGICISLFTGAFFFPLFYLGGEEKSEVSLVISLLCGIGITLGIISTLNLYLAPGLTAILLGNVILVVCSLLMFALSYPLTVSIYKKKEY